MRFFMGLMMSLACAAASAQSWQLVSDESEVAFMTIKSRHTAEVHQFMDVTGGIEGAAGTVSVRLGSWNTNIAIRDERMTKEILKGDADMIATATVEIPENLLSLKAGESSVYEGATTIDAFGVKLNRPITLRVVAVSDDQLRVTSVHPMLLSTQRLTVGSAIGKLRLIAGLKDISQAVPVSVDLLFKKAN